jgi:hypothetical protein
MNASRRSSDVVIWRKGDMVMAVGLCAYELTSGPDDNLWTVNPFSLPRMASRQTSSAISTKTCHPTSSG